MDRRLILWVVLSMFAAVAAGCGPRQTVVRGLGNAENSLFTPDGRLFISGADIWEIKQADRGHQAVSLAADHNCQFSGMAQYKGHLFAICYADGNGDAWLTRAELTDHPVFEKIFQLTGFSLANGMALDDGGHLYIADSTVVNAKGKIVRLSLTDDSIPQVVESSRMAWLKAEEGAQSPNGMTIVGDTLFFSNIDTTRAGSMFTNIKRTTIVEDGHGPVETVFERTALRNSSLIDDFTSIEVQGRIFLIAADYLKGTILAIDAQSTGLSIPLHETDPDKFAGPTSCIVGRGIGFDSEDLLVTEGGIVTIDPSSNFGNRLSTVRFEPPD